jgi:hypothetical protein
MFQGMKAMMWEHVHIIISYLNLFVTKVTRRVDYSRSAE